MRNMTSHPATSAVSRHLPSTASSSPSASPEGTSAAPGCTPAPGLRRLSSSKPCAYTPFASAAIGAETGSATCVQPMAGKFVELGDDLRVGRKLLFASSCCLDGSLEASAVSELDLKAHRVPILGAFGRDCRIVHDLDSVGKSHSLRIRHLILGELVDKTIAFEQAGRKTIGEIELGGSEPLRCVFPADVIHRDLRAVHANGFDFLRGKRSLVTELAKRVQRGVITANAPIE